MRMRLSVTTGTNVQAISENAPVNPALSSAGMSLLRPPPPPSTPSGNLARKGGLRGSQHLFAVSRLHYVFSMGICTYHKNKPKMNSIFAVPPLGTLRVRSTAILIRYSEKRCCAMHCETEKADQTHPTSNFNCNSPADYFQTPCRSEYIWLKS